MEAKSTLEPPREYHCLPMIREHDIIAILRTVPDPELPINIVDLGLVSNVQVSSAREEVNQMMAGEIAAHARPELVNDSSTHPPTPSLGRRGSLVRIELLPTFIGCPALDMIAGDVRAKVSSLPGVGEVQVNWVFSPPWSVDRITAEGRSSLKAHGVAVPLRGGRLHVPGHESPQSVTLRTSAVPCPFCGSTSTYLDSPFGPTRCRTIHYCESCRNSFEQMKSAG